MFGPTDSPTYRRNFRLGVLNGLFYLLAEVLTDPTLVLVAFISHLTRSPFWLGLVVPLRDGAWFLPQLWVSGYLQSQPRKLPFYNRISVVRGFSFLLLVVATLTLRSPGTLLFAFFALYAVYSVASGFGGLPFLEIVGKTVPPSQRGLYFAWRDRKSVV